MMHSGTSYSSESNSDQERSVNEHLPIVQSQHIYGNMPALMPQVSGFPYYFPSQFYTGQPQAYHPSFPGSVYGHVMPSPVSIMLPNVPIMLPPFPFISPQLTGAAMYYPFPFQPVQPQIMYQPSFSVSYMPQLNDPQMSSAMPYVPIPLCNEQLQFAYQPPVEPSLSCELDQSNLSSNYVEHPQSTSQPSFDSTFDEGQQFHDSSVSSQVQSAGLAPTSNIYSSSSNCVEQAQSTYQSSLDPTFDEGQQPDDSILPSQVQNAGLAHTSNINPSSFYHHGQAQITYQPSSDPAFCGRQMYDYEAQGSGIEHAYAPQELNNDIRPTITGESSFSLINSEEPQSTYLASPKLVSDYPLESSEYQVLNSALGSLNQEYSVFPNYSGLYSWELSNPLAVLDFGQTVSPGNSDLASSLKRAADEIYASGSEFGSPGQPAAAPCFEDAPRPRKRWKEAYVSSTSCVTEEKVQSLSATSHYYDSHNLDSFPVDGYRVSHDQRMNFPVQSDPSIDHYESKNDTLMMLHGARNFRISGNPTFTNIGVNNVTNPSGAHDLESLTKFVSFDALHDSSVQDPDRRCHPGTRTNVIARLQAWTDDPYASEHIVWLHGLPGAGKSSVAQTIIRNCDREKIAATFFFYRSDPSRSDGNRLFTTITWQLASSIPCIKPFLVNSLTHRPDLPMKDVETQFEELVVQPLNDSASNLDLSLAPVVVIDGIDECTDENLQRRFLNVIGNAIRDRRVPLRFLILSRPEAHIKETVDQFKCPTLRIDLDSIDNANHDIEFYLNAQFSRIARERGFDTTWPGDCIIQRLVCNSSGQFVYAATVIKYTGDAYNCAKAQLDIILGLKTRPSASPFAPLDDLYTEILKRQPDQDFLKDVLALLVVFSSIDYENELQADFPTLLNVSKEVINRKLRGMQSLLGLEKAYIEIHHRSFLDFLQDASRSAQYHISKRASSRRYLELITDAIVRYVSDVIDHPQRHDTQHLHLQYSVVPSWWPLNPKLAVEDLREVLQPLVGLQDKLLNRPNLSTNRELLSCNECNAFEVMQYLLLHLALKRGMAESYSIASSSTVKGPLMFEQEEDCSTTTALPGIEAENNISDMDLDMNFASLLAYMRDMPSTSSPTMSALELIHSLLRFDCVEIIKKVSSISDAQNLMNLIDYMLHDQNSVQKGGMNLTCKAIQLVLDIYIRVPVLPQLLLLNGNALGSTDKLEFDNDLAGDDLGIDTTIEHVCKGVLIGRVLNNCHFIAHGPGPLVVMDRNDMLSFIDEPRRADVRYWRIHSNPSHSAMYQLMLRLSRSIQYIHSVGIVLDSFHISADSISWCSEFTFDIWCLDIEGLKSNKNAYEDSVFIFGHLFYQIFFNISFTYPSKFSPDRIKIQRDAIVKRPSKPEIREDAWKLIQRCCAENPKSRPTIDEVVQEMESWGIER